MYVSKSYNIALHESTVIFKFTQCAIVESKLVMWI